MTVAQEQVNPRRRGIRAIAGTAKRLLPALALMGLLKAGEVRLNSAPRREFERKVAAQTSAGMFEPRETVDHARVAKLLGHEKYFLTQKHTDIADASGLINEVIRTEVARHKADPRYAQAARFVTPDFIHAILVAESGLAPWDANYRIARNGGGRAAVPLRNGNAEIFANGLGQVTEESLGQAIKDGAVPAGTKLFEMRPLIPPKAARDALRSVSASLDTSEFREAYGEDLERFARMKGKRPRELTPQEIGAENERRIRLNLTNAVHTAFFNSQRFLENLANSGMDFNNVKPEKLDGYIKLSYKDGGWGAFRRFTRNYQSKSDRVYIANRRKALEAVRNSKIVTTTPRPEFKGRSVPAWAYLAAGAGGLLAGPAARAMARRNAAKRRQGRRGRKAARMASWN